MRLPNLSQESTSVAQQEWLCRQKLQRLLTNDPGMGVIRHVDAGYERAVEVARERGVRVPMEPVIRNTDRAL